MAAFGKVKATGLDSRLTAFTTMRIPTDIQCPADGLAQVGALLQPPKGLSMRSAAQTGNSTRPTQPPAPIQSLAKHNRKPPQLIENKHQRPKSIASFCRVFRDCRCRGAQSRKPGRAATNTTAKETRLRAADRGRHFTRQYSRITTHSSPLAPTMPSPHKTSTIETRWFASYAPKVENTCRRWEASK